MRWFPCALLGGLHMRTRQHARITRRTGWVILASAAILVAVIPSVGGAAARAATAGPSPTASPPPGSADGVVKLAGAKSPPVSCRKGVDGRVASCPPALSQPQLPAGAKNKATLSTVGAPATLVDTRTWTSSGGNTFPGADVPFGMVQWSPDTMPTYNAGGGYQYGDESLWGYSLTHVSGPGCGAAGDVPILPMTGALPS